MPKKILIADDDINLRGAYKILFSSEYDVVEASNGRELVEKAFEVKPDIIITDIVMPALSGYRAIQKLDRDKKFKNTVVVFNSGNITDQDIYEMHKPKNMHSVFIDKPFNKKDLSKKIEYLINKLEKSREGSGQD